MNIIRECFSLSDPILWSWVGGRRCLTRSPEIIATRTDDRRTDFDFRSSFNFFFIHLIHVLCESMQCFQLNSAYKYHKPDKLRVGPLPSFASYDVPLLRCTDYNLSHCDLLFVQLVVSSQLVHLNAICGQSLKQRRNTFILDTQFVLKYFLVSNL